MKVSQIIIGQFCTHQGKYYQRDIIGARQVDHTGALIMGGARLSLSVAVQHWTPDA